MTAFLLGVAVSSLARTPSAHAQSPCWHRVVADWSAGSLGDSYPIACYEAAIAHLPEDVRIYSSAEADIRRAMLAALPVRAKRPRQRPCIAPNQLQVAVVHALRGVPQPLRVAPNRLQVALAHSRPHMARRKRAFPPGAAAGAHTGRPHPLTWRGIRLHPVAEGLPSTPSPMSSVERDCVPRCTAEAAFEPVGCVYSNFLQTV